MELGGASRDSTRFDEMKEGLISIRGIWGSTDREDAVLVRMGLRAKGKTTQERKVSSQ